MTQSRVKRLVAVGVLIVCVAINAWIYWPRDRAKVAIVKAGGIVQTLTRPDHKGEVAVTLPATVGDAELTQMSALEQLQPTFVQLQGRQITGESLKWLQRFPSLFGLTLHGTKVGDDDLVYLATFPKLEMLNLESSPVSDRGLVQLKHLPSLKSVSLRGTRVTAQGVEKLQKARSDLQVLSGFMRDDDD
jgi:hypothetical protein